MFGWVCFWGGEEIIYACVHQSENKVVGKQAKAGRNDLIKAASSSQPCSFKYGYWLCYMSGPLYRTTLTRWQNCVCDFVRMAYRSRNGWCRRVCVWEANGWENSCTCQSSAHMSDKVHRMMLLLVTGLQQGMGPNSHFHVDCGPQF